MSQQAFVFTASGLPHATASAKPTLMKTVPNIRAMVLLWSGMTAHLPGRRLNMPPRLLLALLSCATAVATRSRVTCRCVLACLAREWL